MPARSLTAVATIAASLASLSAADAQDTRLSRECRREIVRLCGLDRAAMRQCLADNHQQLSANCKSSLAARVQARLQAGEGQRADRQTADKDDMRSLAYGDDPLQTFDFYPASKPDAPLVVFVHGGGWKRGDKAMMRGSDKLSDWHGKGYAVASLNYRLVPAAKVEDQAADVAAAVASLRRQAGELGFDAQRMVLVGHSAGAHLVSLVGTDPQWLRGAGLPMDAVRGIIALDGAAYHVPSQMDQNARLMGETYAQAFGKDPARQLALSPSSHGAVPNAPAFLILHITGRSDAKTQNDALAAALRSGGTPVTVHAIPGRGLQGHMEINRKLGDPAYAATPIVDSWLAEVFAR